MNPNLAAIIIIGIAAIIFSGCVYYENKDKKYFDKKYKKK